MLEKLADDPGLVHSNSKFAMSKKLRPIISEHIRVVISRSTDRGEILHMVLTYQVTRRICPLGVHSDETASWTLADKYLIYYAVR